MSESIGPKEEKFDSLKWFIIACLIGGGVWANFHYTESVAWALRFAAGIVVFMVAFAIFLRTTKGAEFWDFAKESRVELRKVVWPTRQETVQSTITVAIMVFIMSILLWMVDSVLMRLVSVFTG